MLDLKDYSQKKLDAPQEMTVVDPATGEEMEGVSISLLGVDSTPYKKLQRERQQKFLDKMQKKGKQSIDVSAEEIELRNIEELVKLTTDIKGFNDGGELVEFSPEVVEIIYKEHSWLFEQAWSFVNDRANFF